MGTGRHGARANELKGIGTHIGYTQFLNNIERVLDNAETLGLPHVGTANSRGVIHGETTEGYKRAAEDFNAVGAAAARGSTSTTTRASSRSTRPLGSGSTT